MRVAGGTLVLAFYYLLPIWSTPRLFLFAKVKKIFTKNFQKVVYSARGVEKQPSRLSHRQKNTSASLVIATTRNARHG